MATSQGEKVNLLKQHKDQYAAPKEPTLVEMGEASYLVVRGSGEPGSELFQNRIGALYAVAYTVKFNSKFAGRDFVVGKLEGLYGVDGQTVEDVSDLPPADWNWRLMIRVPAFISRKRLAEARQTLRDKGKEGDFDAVSLDTYREGRCVQMLHVGPYEDESETIDRMYRFARDQRVKPHMWHHEIYLSDPRRVPPERLRTILRHPVRG